MYFDGTYKTNGAFDDRKMQFSQAAHNDDNSCNNSLTTVASDCQSGQYCKKANGDCSSDISSCTSCTATAPSSGDAWRQYFDHSCGRCPLCSSSYFISLFFTLSSISKVIARNPQQTVFARTPLSTTARRAGLTIRASQPAIFVYVLSHPRNVPCNARLVSRK